MKTVVDTSNHHATVATHHLGLLHSDIVVIFKALYQSSSGAHYYSRYKQLSHYCAQPLSLDPIYSTRQQQHHLSSLRQQSSTRNVVETETNYCQQQQQLLTNDEHHYLSRCNNINLHLEILTEDHTIILMMIRDRRAVQVVHPHILSQSSRTN